MSLRLCTLILKVILLGTNVKRQGYRRIMYIVHLFHGCVGRKLMRIALYVMIISTVQTYIFETY